jgi:hypothetical protein
MTPTNVRSILPGVWQVPQVFRDRLGDRVGRQRAMFHEGHLLLVLHAPPGPEEATRKGRFFWRQPDGTWSSSEFGSSPQAVDRHLGEYAKRLEELEQMEEHATDAETWFHVLEAIAPVHRAAAHLHQALQHAREQVPQARELINFRDRAYEVERTAELLHTDAKNALDFAVARLAEEQARASHRMAVSAHRLNVLAALFFPITALSALLGVNLAHGLESTVWDPLPFFALIGAGLVFGLLLTAFITRPPE